MGKLDVALKHSLSVWPRDWARFLGVPDGLRVEAVDVDLSAITQMADKLLRVDADEPYLIHVEPQSYPDAELDLRMLHYNATASRREGLPVHSVAVLLHQGAMSSRNSGTFRTPVALTGCRLEFEYRLIKVWELPPDVILEAGVGILPLAPLADVRTEELPSVVDRMSARMRSAVPLREEAELWTATLILMGLKYSRELTELVLRGVRSIMQQSPTYQAILEEGREEGREEGVVEGMQKTILRQGAKRIRPASADVADRIRSIHDPDVLDALLLRLLDVSTWDDLLAGVDVPPSTNSVEE